jgi:hypothetical protein
MKQILLLATIIITSSFTVKGQMDEGSFNISLIRKYPINNTRINEVPLTGVEVEYMALDNLGLNYSMYGGNGVFHMPGGVLVAVGLAALVSYGGEVDPEVLLYSLALPEGVSYNFKMVDNVYFTPYINPLGFEINYLNNEKPRGFLTGSTGIKFKALIPNANFWVNGDNYKLFMSAFSEAQLEYKKGSEVVARSGFGLGIAF